MVKNKYTLKKREHRTVAHRTFREATPQFSSENHNSACVSWENAAARVARVGILDSLKVPPGAFAHETLSVNVDGATCVRDVMEK